MVVHSYLGSILLPSVLLHHQKKSEVRFYIGTPSLLHHHPCRALLTHISAKRGMIHLRIGQPTDTYMAQDEEQGMQEEKLPFSLCLQKFEAKMHDGTNAVADYSSKFTVIDGDDKSEGEVSMNNIYSHRSYRLYQSSYDEDGKGSVLAINADPYGIPVTYTGYAALHLPRMDALRP